MKRINNQFINMIIKKIRIMHMKVLIRKRGSLFKINIQIQIVFNTIKNFLKTYQILYPYVLKVSNKAILNKNRKKNNT
jgi:hypothetical protein